MLTAGGFVCIESIKEGDEVYSCEADTGEIGLKKVQKTYVHEVTELVHLTIDNETIDTTREHPFFLEGLGFIAASELRAGDEIRLYDGSTGVVKSVEIETLKNHVNVYNFEVEDRHTYYVGEEGALVHNSCSKEETLGRKGAFREAKRDAGIASSEQPIEVRRAPMREAEYEGGHVIKDAQGNVIMTREYYYKNRDGNTIVIQDHGAGHTKGEQRSHFNVRPESNTRNGKVNGTKDHYVFQR